MPFIRETILTTISDDGGVHIAPLGIIQDGDHWIIAPFRPSTTLANLEATGIAVVNYTDEAKIFAGCLTGRRDWPVVAVPDCRVPRLEAALSHDVLEVVAVKEDATRPRFSCRVTASGQHRPFQGMNRAKAAVLEAAILVSRLHMLPAEKIEDEIAYLKIAIDKTAGPDEEQAWYWLLEKVIDHLATVEGEG
ncbi:DUF447 domain-containing protein [Aurantimonas endophytica]|uniref:DUF447 family protein n=1 Tax=Aurantimonas endophytica TaxID=1522175 RepID=A0A7W6HDR2_9HYPH|nr:DUF447 domain-containing protein [Aurantimonas endophytica]MBB4003351.1 hypothetical protein [Aurantimonas endophytica]MCO6404212.1 DUF447 family protein [Aurantimonas endophytica]